MLMPVLAVCVVVQAAHYDRTAGRATGGRGKGIEKKGSVFGEGVDGGSLGYFVSIATEGGGFVISDEEDDVFLGRKKYAHRGGEQEGKDELANDHGVQVAQRTRKGQGFGVSENQVCHCG